MIHCIGHNNYIRSLAFSPNGLHLASAADDKTMRVWDVTSGTEIVRHLHTGSVMCVTYSRSGKRLATTSEHNTIRIFETDRYEMFTQLERTNDFINIVAFSPDESCLVSGACHNDIFSDADADLLQVWDIASGRVLHELIGHTDSIACVAYSSDGNYIASGSRDNSVRVWNAIDATCVAHRLHRLTVRCVAFSGADLLYSMYNQVMRWNFKSDHVALYHHIEKQSITSVDVSANNRFIIIGALDSGVQIIENKESGLTLRRYGGSIGTITRSALSRDEKRIAFASISALTFRNDNHITIASVLDHSLFVNVASVLIESGVAPYVVLDILDFISADATTSCHAAESVFHHLDKIRTIERLRQAIIKT